MRIPIMLRSVLVALIALIGVSLQSAHADIGGITLVVYKGGWFIGGSAGHGTLNFHGRSYRLDGWRDRLRALVRGIENRAVGPRQ